MQRENAGEGTDLGSAGAFIDTTGENKRKKTRITHSETFARREEEELEALVFGGRVFQPQGAESSDDSESGDEVEVVRGESGGRGGDEPAWRDEDDDEIRSQFIGVHLLNSDTSQTSLIFHKLLSTS